MELPASFMVQLILGLIMFAVGLTIAFEIYDWLNITVEEFQEKIKQDMADAITAGDPQKVKAAYVSDEVHRGKFSTLVIGIANLGNDTDTFYTNVKCAFAVTRDKAELCNEYRGISCSALCGSWALAARSIRIRNNEVDTVPIRIEVPKSAQLGSYWFDVNVCTGAPCETDGRPYDNAKKLSISVI